MKSDKSLLSREWNKLKKTRFCRRKTATQETFVGLQEVFKAFLQYVFKTYLQEILKTSLAQHVLSSKASSRSLEDVLITSWRHLARRLCKTSWRCLEEKTKNCGAKDVVKTSWRHNLKTPWRRLRDKQNIYRGYLYLKNLNVYLRPPLVEMLFIVIF